MAVRPYLTTGAAIVSAGALIAALPAIVPSPTPPDVKIAAGIPKNPYVNDVKLQATLQELVDTFFDSGFDGITRDLLLEIVGDNEASVDAINGVFDTGFEELVQQWLVASTTDPVQLELINGFFDGVPIDETDPDSETFPAGFTELVRQFLRANADDATDTNINTFFESGFDGLAREFLLAATSDATGQALINTFFDDGFDGLAREFLLAATPDAAGDELIETFFADGFDGLAETFALAAVAGDPDATAVVESFVNGYPFADDGGTPEDPSDDTPAGKAGFVGLIHYVVDSLIGGVVQSTVVTTFAPLSVEETTTAAELPEANSTIDTNAKTVDVKVETTVEPDPDDSTTAAAAKAPAAASAPESTTSATPAPATPVVDDGAVDETLSEEGEEGAVENPGNKFTPPILVFANNGGKRDNPWRQAWNDTIKTITGGGSTTPDTASDDASDPE